MYKIIEVKQSVFEDNNKDVKVDVHVSLGESFVNEYF